MISKLLLVLVAATVSTSALALERNMNAPKGGVFNYSMDAEPENIHPVMSGDVYSRYVKEYLYDGLCDNDAETWELMPHIAEKWDISKDGLTFTFFLRKDAYFHNGENITAEDVKFSYEAVLNPKHEALNMLPYFDKVKSVDVVDKYTVRFNMSEKYFGTLTTLCTNMYIIPKSVYGDITKSVKLQKDAVGSGPYKLEKYDKAQLIVAKKFDKWYGDKVPHLKGLYNFDQVNFRFTKDDNILIERLKKGDVDFARFTTDSYKKATGGNFGKTVFAVKVENSEPKTLSFIGFNLQKEIFKDKNTRLAFAHLVNRELMIKKFFNGWNYLATGPEFVKSPAAQNSKPIPFDPKKAQTLLAQAGWTDSDKDGVLDKTVNGQKVDLRVSFIYANKDSEKYWTIVKEDAKKAGVDIELKFLEWNSFIKSIDSRSFDLMAMAWGGGDVESDPKQIWHSTSNGKGGSNYINYNNPEVDKLIDQGRGELDPIKRRDIFKKANTLIADDVPYIFLWSRKFEYYGQSNKIKRPGDTFKYNFGYRSWWSASAK
ncbi:MAG: peptide ABC transporter substrate-binding protein [Bdellovibrionaceae bacterium]|nr:peptide ABC transporter substrate-binding protein [Bdellovibrio sp.]